MLSHAHLRVGGHPTPQWATPPSLEPQALNVLSPLGALSLLGGQLTPDRQFTKRAFSFSDL
jgi:hypothetical protein